METRLGQSDLNANYQKLNHYERVKNKERNRVKMGYKYCLIIAVM